MKKFLALLLIFPLVANAAIGNIDEHKGTASIKRGKETVIGKKGSVIETDDLVIVGSNSETHITFQDKTQVRIKANSRLVIDDFVYDPKASDAGKMAMKVALGTVQYTSGQIAKSNRQHMNIKTPTAQIAVRGTDFSMTVDEAGQSLIVLLPSCDDPKKLNNYQVQGNCTVGVIDVETAAGIVTLNQPFTATLVISANAMPLAPVAIDPSQQISNLMILSRPQTVSNAEKDREEEKKADIDRSLYDEDERNASRKKTSTTTVIDETKLIGLNGANGGQQGTPETNPCYPFNDCGNLSSRNWYRRVDEDRGNVIFIKSDERTDNTTYNISINNNDVETKIVGDGSNSVTVRIWNR